jgi:hypothetical protein
MQLNQTYGFLTSVIQNSWSWPTIFPEWSFLRKKKHKQCHVFWTIYKYQ